MKVCLLYGDLNDVFAEVFQLKFMFFKKATKIEKIFTNEIDNYLVNTKSMVKIWSIFVAFLEKMNFKQSTIFSRVSFHFLKQKNKSLFFWKIVLNMGFFFEK